MPRLSVVFIRASLLYLWMGILFGALILAEKGISYYPLVWRLFPVHIEFLLVGWLVQLAMGVAFWIFPRFGSGQPGSRGNEMWIRVSLVLVNLGIFLVVLQLWLSSALLLGRFLETMGITFFVMGLWRRVKPHGA